MSEFVLFVAVVCGVVTGLGAWSLFTTFLARLRAKQADAIREAASAGLCIGVFIGYGIPLVAKAIELWAASRRRNEEAHLSVLRSTIRNAMRAAQHTTSEPLAGTKGVHVRPIDPSELPEEFRPKD
jgi:hypothetical protein